MTYISYLSNLTKKNFDTQTKPYTIHENIKHAIIGENHYPLIEHHDGQDLFVIILPFYNNKNNTISLLECDILKDKDHCFVITDDKDALIKKIVDMVSSKKESSADTMIFELLLQLCNHILTQISLLENRIILLKEHTVDKGNYNENTINAIMQLKVTIGMFKSTMNPFDDIIRHLFETISNSNDILQEFRKNQLDHLISQIKAQSQFLYENISIVADTCNAVQNIHANNIMKILTIISSIFIPLSFIAGVFGMNFNAIPGHSELFYYSVLIGMTFIGLLQLYVFKKKGRF